MIIIEELFRSCSRLNFAEFIISRKLLKNIWKKECISNGIDLKEVTHYEEEKEILFEPFTFCHVDDVVFDVKKYTADIYLETIGKTEILENAIKNGNKIEYNEKLNIIEIKH